MSGHQSQSLWAKFGLWFFQNVFMPLSPLLIASLTDSLINVSTSVFSEETVLIYSILLPVLYLEVSEGAVQRYVFWGISAVGIVLYTAARVVNDLPVTSRPVGGTSTIYHLAAILDAIYILTACAYEAYDTFSSNRQVA